MYSLEFTILLLLLEFYYGATHSSTLCARNPLKTPLCPNCQESISEEKTTEPVQDLEENLWSAISLCILTLKEIRECWKLQTPLFMEWNGEGANNWQVQLHSNIEVVVYIPISPDIFHQVE